jgi:hypothetical protein
MYARVQYNWEDPEAFIEEDGVLNVEFPWDEEDTPWRCINCEERFTEDAKDEVEDDEECVQAECSAGHDCDEVEDPVAEPCQRTHDLVNDPQPFTWVNGASIRLNEESDQIDLAISIGDPRGAFVMSLFRTRDGQIRMEVPHPEDGFLHLPLRQLGRALYAVNETEPKEKSE